MQQLTDLTLHEFYFTYLMKITLITLSVKTVLSMKTEYQRIQEWKEIWELSLALLSFNQIRTT